MFRINRRTDYAMRVMLCLARRSPGARLSTRTVQQEMRIPRPYLQRIIAELSRAELLRTYAGPRGGLELALPGEAIHLRRIWEAIEGPLVISDCLEGPQSCPLEAGCPVNRRWLRLQSLIAQELQSVTLAELAQEAGRLPESIPAGEMVENLLIVAG
jgi:Rrf2 family protein